MDKALTLYYRSARRHQMATYGNSGVFENGADLRQFTGGGAAYGEHAIAAYWDAKRSIHIRAEARTWLKQHKAL